MTRLAVAGFVFTAISAVAAILVIPEVRWFLGLKDPQTETSAKPNPQPGPSPSPSSRPAKPSPLVFATKVSTNGQAVDPGTTFPSHIRDLYAVFRADMAPPGMEVNVDDSTTGAYYAYLKVKDDSPVSSFGWRWYHKRRVVNEYETEVQPGDEIWLQRYDYSGDGIFGGDLGPGTYTIVILLGGDPAMSAELTITP
jgi:hypothetical protein